MFFQSITAQNNYIFTEGLAVGSCHQYGREALYTDHLAYQLIQGKIATPTEGGVLMTDKEGKALKWQSVKADTANRLRHAALSKCARWVFK